MELVDPVEAMKDTLTGIAETWVPFAPILQADIQLSSVALFAFDSETVERLSDLLIAAVAKELNGFGGLRTQL